MDSKKLHLLMTAVKEGSLRKAAKECGCTQSAVTQAMDALEAELGFKVITRSHRGVQLTRAGELLYPLLVRADENFTQLFLLASDIATDVNSPVCVGVLGSVSRTWLVPAFEAYRKINPDVSFDLLVGGDSLSTWLRDGQIDVAIGMKEQCGQVIWRPVMDEPCKLVLPHSFRSYKKALNADELKEVPLMMAPRGVMASEDASKLHLLCCDDDSTLLSLVSQDQGVAIVPASALKDAPSDIQVLELDPPATRTIGIALPNSPRPEAKQFADYLCENMPYTLPKDETPEEKAMRSSIRKALGGRSDREWQSSIFR